MSALKDIAGQRFGRLVAKERIGKYRKESVWRCLCDCGKLKDVPITKIGKDTNSCGCLCLESRRTRVKSAATIMATKDAVSEAWKRGDYQGTKSARGPDNAKAEVWRIRSPDNVVYEFKSLEAWIHEHEHLFNAEDVVWHRRGGRMCRALGGIYTLSSRKKRATGSWKGWTWHSQQERLKNEGRDLLERNVA